LDQVTQVAQEVKMTRRDFLASATMATSLAAVGVVAGSFGWQFVYPASAQAPLVQVLATSLSKVPVGARLVLKLAGNEVVLVNHNGKVRAISTVCTHLGCRAAWDENRHQFICPCHTGIFDANGMVLSGPAPRQLDEFPVEVKSGNIYVSVPEKGA